MGINLARHGQEPIRKRAEADRLITSGFTLLEMMTVVTIVSILATLAVPTYRHATTKAREASLKQTLFTVRDVIDQYRADRGTYPSSLEELAKHQYLRELPIDPITRSATTWQTIAEDSEGGIFDIHSGSTLLALDGTAYNVW